MDEKTVAFWWWAVETVVLSQVKLETVVIDKNGLINDQIIDW